MIVLYVLTILLIIAALALNIATAAIKEKCRHLPRCENCYYCKPVPAEAGRFYNDRERHCMMGRGVDESWRLTGMIPSIVTVDEYCSSFLEKEGPEYVPADT